MGTLIGIWVADAATAPMRALDAIECVPGRGLVGDRYFLETGTFSPNARKPSQEVTLVEVEEVDGFNARHATRFEPSAFRRNLVTRGVRLNDLAGQRFAIGSVIFDGIRLCEPCTHLVTLTSPEVLQGLVHRAGLRAAIVRAGTINVGDPVRPVLSTPQDRE
jgi:hypothetical protein